MADDSMMLNLLLNAVSALGDDEKAKRLKELKDEYERIKSLHDDTMQLIAQNREAIGSARAERTALAKEKADLDAARAKFDVDARNLGVQVADHHGKQDEFNRMQDAWHASQAAAEADLKAREASVTQREHDVADRVVGLSEREAAVAQREQQLAEASEHAKRLIAAMG